MPFHHSAFQFCNSANNLSQQNRKYSPLCIIISNTDWCVCSDVYWLEIWWWRARGGEGCKSSVPVTSFWSGRRSQWGNECINVGGWLAVVWRATSAECRSVTEWRKLKIRQLLRIAELSTCCVIHYWWKSATYLFSLFLSYHWLTSPGRSHQARYDIPTTDGLNQDLWERELLTVLALPSVFYC